MPFLRVDSAAQPTGYNQVCIIGWLLLVHYLQTKVKMAAAGLLGTRYASAGASQQPALFTSVHAQPSSCCCASVTNAP